MPQFDFTTYSGQIFWFCICFAALYFSIAKIIAPRIQSIINNRKSLIDADNSLAQELNKEIDEIEFQKTQILNDANTKYKTALEAAQKTANQEKEKMIEEFKNNSSKMIEKSRDEIKKIISSSKEDSVKAADKLALEIQKKIF